MKLNWSCDTTKVAKLPICLQEQHTRNNNTRGVSKHIDFIILSLRVNNNNIELRGICVNMNSKCVEKGIYFT